MAREAVNTCPLVVRVGKFHVVNRAQAARALKEGQEQLELKTKNMRTQRGSTGLRMLLAAGLSRTMGPLARVTCRKPSRTVGAL